MEWEIGNMDKISFKNIKGISESLKPRNSETKKPRKQEPRSQETENQETEKRKPRKQGTKTIFQVRESPAPLNIPTITPAPWPLRPGRGPGPGQGRGHEP